MPNTRVNLAQQATGNSIVILPSNGIVVMTTPAGFSIGVDTTQVPTYITLSFSLKVPVVNPGAVYEETWDWPGIMNGDPIAIGLPANFPSAFVITAIPQGNDKVLIRIRNVSTTSSTAIAIPGRLTALKLW